MKYQKAQQDNDIVLLHVTVWDNILCMIFFRRHRDILSRVSGTKKGYFSRDGDQASGKLSLRAGRPYMHTMQVA